MKIAVYTITKNEEHFIRRWAASCKDADLRLIVDTGSTDNTVQTAIDAGCTVAQISISPWRFDDARNASLALIPADFDYCIALDADEVLVDGWREALEAVPPGVTRPRYKYVWSWNPDGSEGLVYSGDKIHHRRNYRWKHPVHEVAICTGEEVQGWCSVEINHFPDQGKSRSQYLPLLEQAVREDPNDDRNRFYLGRELMYHGRNAEAEVHLRKHLELAGWKAERATCMRYLGRVTGDKEHWFLRACAEAPDRREPWVELAQLYYEKQMWHQCLSSALRALSIKEKPLEYLCESESWGALPHDLASISSWYSGDKEAALAHSTNAIALNPSDIRLRNNHSLILSLMRKTNVDVVIPTKSNIEGLKSLIGVLENDPRVDRVIIVADGEDSYKRLKSADLGKKSIARQVPLESGIHLMWNVGMDLGSEFNHVLFLNDDVEINNETVSILASQLDSDSSLGLICPNYDGRAIDGECQLTSTTSGGLLNGTGGLAGFCMMLSRELRGQWRFDERMKWWYGDDDVINWVNSVTQKKVAISSFATCKNNSSWTTNNDPPKGFAKLVENDKKLFNLKWDINA